MITIDRANRNFILHFQSKLKRCSKKLKSIPFGNRVTLELSCHKILDGEKRNMSKTSKVAAIPPKAAPVASPAPAPVAQPPAAEAVAAESDVPPTVFTLLPGESEFSVNISASQKGPWMAQLNGIYYPPKQVYHFLMLHLAAVEKHLGVAPGGSGLLDPKCFSKIQFEGGVYSADGIDDLKEKLSALGFVYKRQNKTFVGPLSALESVKPFMQQPANK